MVSGIVLTVGFSWRGGAKLNKVAPERRQNTSTSEALDRCWRGGGGAGGKGGGGLRVVWEDNRRDQSNVIVIWWESIK